MSWHCVHTLLRVSRPEPAGRSWPKESGTNHVGNDIVNNRDKAGVVLRMNFFM